MTAQVLPWIAPLGATLAASFDPLPVSWLVLGIAAGMVLVAYLVFGVSGFGASLMTVPVLSQLMPLPLLLSVTVVLDVCAAIVVAADSRRRLRRGAAQAQNAAAGTGRAPATGADRAELWRMMPAALVGSAIGATLLVGLPREASLLALGAFLLGYGLWSWRSSIPQTPLHARWGAPAGFCGGLLGALFGIGGPPYVIYLSRRILDKDRLRATIGVVVLLSLLIRCGVFLAAGLLLQPGLAPLLVLLLPVCIVSVLVGGRIAATLSRAHLLRTISVLLAASGALLIARALGAL
jgi:uncharacterized protein